MSRYTSPLHDANNILVQIFLYSHPCAMELIAEDENQSECLHIVAIVSGINISKVGRFSKTFEKYKNALTLCMMYSENMMIN